jgi:Icc-related predicted phosphoesterase
VDYLKSPVLLRLRQGINDRGIKLKRIRPSSSRTALRLVLLSDTHQLHREIDVPDGDLLIHAGDLTMFSRSMTAVADFNIWLGELPHRHKVVVPGNHEFFLEADLTKRSLLSNAIILINEGIEIEGLRIWGSPVTPSNGGAFGLSSSEDRRRTFAQIPTNTDVLITHGPPFGILDAPPAAGFHNGCQELADAVVRVRPKLHVFGHVHGAHGILQVGGTTYVNAAVLSTDGGPDRSPIVLKMSRA